MRDPQSATRNPRAIMSASVLMAGSAHPCYDASESPVEILMALRDLRAFIRLLEERGQLKRIQVPVSAELEITEIADRMAKRGGPALLFENVVGHRMPVLI